MAVRLSSATWVRGVTDASMSEVVGSGSLARGRTYARDGAVLTLVEGAKGQMLLATVRGNGGHSYQTIVELLDDSDPAAPEWVGECSCPVGLDCKHSAAVMLTARAALASPALKAAPAVSWEAALAPLTVLTLPSADLPPLGLEISLSVSPAYPGRPAVTRVQMRPVRPGKSKPWVKQGLNWSDFARTWRHGQTKARPDHRSLLAELLALHRSAAPAYYGYGNPDVHLGDLGAAVWPVLRRCGQAGIAWVAQGAEITDVQLLDEPAQVVLDIVRAPTGGALGPGDGPHGSTKDSGPVASSNGSGPMGANNGVAADTAHHRAAAGAASDSAGLAPDQALSVRPVLRHSDREAATTPRDTLILLGNPAHGVGVLSAEGRLTLAPLSAPPPEALVPLLTSGTEICIPAADAARFLAHYYPVLARQLPVESSDGSVGLPRDVAPVLTLDVSFEAGHRVELTWGYGYPLPVEHTEPTESSDAEPDGVGLSTKGRSGLLRVGLERGEQDPPRDLTHEQGLLHSVTELELRPSAADRRHPGTTHRIPSRMTPRSPRGVLLGLDTIVFSTQVLPALQARDDVEVRVWGDPAAYQQAAQAPVVQLSTTDSAEGDWFDLAVTVSVAGQHVPFGPLFTALSCDEEVMLLESGTWFALDQPELQTLRTLIEEARELTDADSESLRVSRYQVDLWEELQTLGVVQQQSARWSQTIAALHGLGEEPAPPAPEALMATLRPYQIEGYHWLSALWDARLGGVLADDMGLGKTLQTLAMAVRAWERGELRTPLLVVAPASVVGTWVEEAARFAPDLRVVPVTATGRRRGMPLRQAVAHAHVVVTSYTLLRLEDEDYRAMPWSGLVLDEAQFVKNHRSRTYLAARRIDAPFTLAITGTPLENSLMDLWSMLSLSSPGLFPRPEVFTERYRKPIESGSSPEQLGVLRRRIRPFMLRRSKGEVAPELPVKQEQVVHVELSPAHRRIYGQHLQRERQRVLGLLADLDQNRIAIFRALTLLRQLSLDPALVDPEYAGRGPSAKIDALLEQLAEVTAEGHRALVFSSFTGFLKLVRDRLDTAGIGYGYLDGRTRDRPKRIAQWRAGDDPVFLISLKAGGFGLTLTEADYVFILDPWWNPAAEAQAVDRTHRIGQTRPVMVYRMVSQDTIEEKVVALQERKRDLFARVVDGGEMRGAAITAEDIKDLLDG